ncbi:MAG: aldo/keto reductase [Candidatus Melainabacteria bacterium]|nr:aldo/keto reductase [Candidatus Melainabacteria bacterium]
MKWRGYNLSELMLGTAQLSNAYGIANTLGAPSRSEALGIIATAWQGGINSFDTAPNYGDSESVLGDCLKQLGVNSKALVITKVSRDAFDDEDSTIQSITDSRDKIGTESIFGVLSHHPKIEQILEDKYRRLFSKLKKRKLVQFTGISVYSGEDALKAITSEFFDIIQMPLNVFDRTAVDLDIIDHAKFHDKLLVFRSIFLQGLLIMNAHDLPPKMEFATDTIREWNSFCKEKKLTPVEAAMGIALQLSKGYPLLVGAESASQISNNLDAFKKGMHHKNLIEDSKILLKKSTVRLCNPSLW